VDGVNAMGAGAPGARFSSPHGSSRALEQLKVVEGNKSRGVCSRFERDRRGQRR
jgi:hypothetical protein